MQPTKKSKRIASKCAAYRLFHCVLPPERAALARSGPDSARHFGAEIRVWLGGGFGKRNGWGG